MPVAQAAPGLTKKLKIKGAPASDELISRLTEFVLDDSTILPDMLELTFVDTNAGFFEANTMRIGDKIEVEMVAAGQPPSKFEGDIVSIGASYHVGKFHATIRAFDVSHRLNRGRMTKTYEQMTASDICSNILAEAGIQKGKIESTTVKFPFLTVANETPFAFLRRLAAEHGLEAVAAQGKMHFRKPEATGEAIVIELGGSLLSLDAEISGSDQVKDIQVSGWDPKQKKELVGKAVVATKAAKLQETPQTIATKMGASKKLVIGGVPIETQAHAAVVAKATAEQHGSAFIDVRGTVAGHTGIRAGAKLKLEGVGKQLSGEYVLSSTRHIWTQDHGYITEFTVSGQQDRSLGGLVQGAAGPRSARSIGGLVTGIVTDNKDPDGVGRVKVAFPWLDAEHVSGWARVAYHGGGPDRGITFLPEVNDEVVVGFTHGDPDKPMVMGAVFNGKDKFPDKASGTVTDRGKTLERGIFTNKHKLTFNDKAGAEGITLGMRDKSYMITLDKKGTVISIGSDGKVDVKAKSGVTITAEQGNIELTAKAGDVKLNGMNVTVEAKAGLTLSSTGPAKLKGATVAIG